MRGIMLVVAAISLASCGKGICIVGSGSGDGCSLPKARATCDAGQVRGVNGECQTPYGYDFDNGGGIPPADDTDPPIDTDIAGDSWNWEA